MRLDVFLAENGFCESRTEAKNFIENGAVAVGGKTVRKPAFAVDGLEETVTLDRSGKKYVSRGGLKLEAALDAFGVSCIDALCVDVGASSGGFTDCLLQHGAKHVAAVDSGSGQMVNVLRNDPRVTVIENYNARNLISADLPFTPTVAVMDVSFISSRLIIPAVFRTLDYGSDFILLIKPQFEVGRSGLGKGGIVRDEAKREEAVGAVIDFACRAGFLAHGLIRSPIEGGDGNIEYLAHFSKPF